MAHIKMSLRSEVLGMSVPVTVILPDRTKEEVDAGKLHPVLWLLHGASDDHTAWARETSIDRYARHAGLCVVMASARMSRYRDMAHGGKYFTFFADELPLILGRMFPLSARREDNFVCGLSMGGAGAFRLGLMRPGQYAAIGCLSAALSNVRADKLKEPGVREGYALAFGEQDPTSEMDEMRQVAVNAVESGVRLPRVYHCCGTEDFLLDNARATRDFFQGLQSDPFGYVYEEDAGAHTWGYWDEHIQRFLAFIKE